MKILQINKFFYPRGGAETYLLSLISLLEQDGYQIVGFSQKNKNNIKLPGEEFFIEEICLDKFYFKNIFKIGRIFWSFKARKNIRKLIRQEKPDLVHLHNIYHQISPSILPAIKKAGLPIVMTVHDFKLIAPDYTLWATDKKSSKSFLAKLLMALEYQFHKSIRVYEKNIDLFIAPSDFVKNKLVEAGFKTNKIIVLPHFIDQEMGLLQSSAQGGLPRNDNEENYIAAFGRLDKSKGFDLLLRALAQLTTDVKLKIVGNGSEEKPLKKLAHSLKIENRVEFISQIAKKDLEKIISQSLFTVFPSRVHETFGLGIIESYALARPVVASRVGAFSEIVSEQTGLLFESDDIKSLKKSLETLINNKDLRLTLGRNAQKIAEEKFNSRLHLEKLVSIYKLAITNSKIKERHYELEKKYAFDILKAPLGPVRNQIIAKAYEEINQIVNNYKKDGITGYYYSTFKMISRLAPKNGKILDYGCGNGELVELLNNCGYRAEGFDVAKTQVRPDLANKLITGDLNQLKNKYDLIVADNVIEHIAADETKEILKKLKNLLTDRGKLLIITPHKLSGPHDISREFLKLGSQAQGLHLKEFDLNELVKNIKDCDYKNISGYLFNPRAAAKVKISLKPNKLWLKKSLLLEKMFNLKIFGLLLRLNRNLTRVLIALMFPTIIVAQK